jgi:hypothetical protein
MLMDNKIFKRKRREKPYTEVDNLVLRNSKITYKAKGFYAMLCSFPDDWVYNMSHLIKISKEGRDAVYSMMKELIDIGLVCRTDKVNKKGHRTGCEYMVLTDVKEEEINPAYLDKPHTENPYTEKPHTDNTYITNKDYTNKESKERDYSNYPQDVRFKRLLTSKGLNDYMSNLKQVLKEIDSTSYPEKFKDYKNAELWYNLVIKANHLKEPPVEWMNSKVSTVAKAVLEFIQNQQVMKVIQKIQNGHIQNIEVLPHNFISKFNRYE